MSRQQVLRVAARSIPRQTTSSCTSRAQLLPTQRRLIASSAVRRDENDRYRGSSTASLGVPGYEHEGSASRTDKRINLPHPEDADFPPEPTVQGRGGPHLKRTLPSFSLEGRTGIVTGGARGLGLVMAQAMIASGADVAIVDLNKAEAEASAKSIIETFKKDNPNSETYDRSKFAGGKKEGIFRVPKVTAHHCDVSNPESVESTIAAILKEHGKIDHLVTSAGFTENFDAIEYPYERMKKLWGVNVDGTYLFACGVAKHLMERKCTKGSIVCIGSMSGAIVNIPQPQAPYNAAKAAVRHLAASMAVEWAHAAIRVNCISPGYMLTALTRKILDENPELNRTWTSLIPMGKMGRPEDLMGPVTFLLSDASLYVTGADLRVDGGYTCT